MGKNQHPLRDELVLQMDAIAKPLSPKTMVEALGMNPFGGNVDFDRAVSLVSYHVKVLLGYEAISLSHQEPVRGAVQNFYILKPGVVVADEGDGAALDQISKLLTEGHRGVVAKIAAIVQETGRDVAAS